MKEKKKRMDTHQIKPINPGQEVYFQAFTKQNPEILYVCKGEVTKVPDENKNKVYRVKVKAVSNKSVTGKTSEDQRALIGRAITKHKSELTLKLGSIFQPKTWLK